MALSASLVLGIGLLGTGLAWGQEDLPEALPPDEALSAEQRVSQLELRIAELEDRLTGAEADPDDASVTGRGGVAVEAGRVVFDAVGLGGPVDIAGTVRGNAVGVGADVRVHDGGRIDGHAVSLGGDVLVDPGAEVDGQQLSLGVEEGVESALVLPVTGDLQRFGRIVARRMALLLVFAAAGTLAVSVWPRQVDDVAARISDRPFWYGMAGAVLSVALSLGAALLSITVIGLPLALLFLVVLGLAWLVGMAAVCRTAGRRVVMGRRLGDTGAYLLGAALVAALSMVPAVGTVLALVIGLPAVGAAVVAGLSGQEHRREW